jgi:NADH dehydrogenase
MALIGKRSGIASLFGMSVGGILAWMMWRNLFITKVPTFSKKIRLILDWTGDAIFDRDISKLKFANNKKVKEYETEAELDDFW